MNQDIKKALEVLRSGGIVLYPTDTVWGLGCDAENKDAIQRIYEIKQREDTKSMLLLIDTAMRLEMYVEDIPEIAWDLLEESDTPLTIIYPKAKNLPSILMAEDQSIGIRLTNDTFCKQLIARFQKPIVSTSANISGRPFPRNFNEISSNILNQVDYIVKIKQDEMLLSNPSSIIKFFEDNTFKIIRE